MAHVKQKNSGLWVPQSTHEKIDSQKMFIENMEQHEANHTELIERIHGKVDSIAKLKALDVSSADSTIKSGTIVVVDGIGPYYYTLLSEEKADDEEIVAPNTGEGLWILSGGGGNLIVDEVDYGEDTDSDQDGLVLKIKKLFNKKTKTNFFPVTTTKAVRDTSTGKSLFQLLNIIPMTEDEGEIDPAEIRDADTLGGISADEFAQKKDYGGIICVLLAENWVENGSSYTYTIAIPSLTGDEFFDVSLYDDGSATQEQISAFNELITRIDVNNGAVVVQASAQPTVSLSIVLRGMCNIDETTVVNLSEVVSKVNEFEKSLEEINSNLTWNKLGRFKLNETLTLPNNWNELYFISSKSETAMNGICGVIYNLGLTNTPYRLAFNGYIESNNGQALSFMISTKSITFNQYTDNGTITLTNGICDIYYR